LVGAAVEPGALLNFWSEATCCSACCSTAQRGDVRAVLRGRVLGRLEENLHLVARQPRNLSANADQTFGMTFIRTV